MRAAPLAAAVVLVAAAWHWRRSLELEQLQATDGTDDFAVDAFDDSSPTWTDNAMATVNETINTFLGTPASEMRSSEQLLRALKKRERLVLVRYRLGDGGWTIGYGRYYPDGGAVPPERIDQATAEAWFAQDVVERGERWVKAYVTVPLLQQQFDALVHMAFNLSPKSFRNIAEAVNRGEDPEAQAMRYIRAGTDLEAGLRNRRAEELAMFRSGVYA